MEQCNGLQQCKVTLDIKDFNTPLLLRNYEQFVFVQVDCQQDEEMLFLKNVMGLCSAVIGLGICLVFRTELAFRESANLINEKIFDGQLITVGDYSIQGKITRDQYQKFLKDVNNGNDENAIARFEHYLIKEIENWLMKQDDNKNHLQSTYAVADLQLAFDNDCMMNLLTKRGLALKAGKFEEVKKIQEQMTKRKNEEEIMERLFTPKLFFCTFHHEYAYHKAVEVNKK